VERLVGAGATKLGALEGYDFYAVSMTDPEGNESDLN